MFVWDPLSLTQSSMASNIVRKPHRQSASPLHCGLGPMAPEVGTVAAPSSCQARQSLTQLWSPRTPLLFQCHSQGREACLSIQKGCFPVSPSFFHHFLRILPLSLLHLDLSEFRENLPQQTLQSLKRQAGSEWCHFL